MKDVRTKCRYKGLGKGEAVTDNNSPTSARAIGRERIRTDESIPVDYKREKIGWREKESPCS